MIRNHIAYGEFFRNISSVSKAEGSVIFNAEGKRFIDFTSGWNVTNLGWNHPEVNEAMARQIEKNVYAPLWSSDPMQEEYAALLTGSLPKELDTCLKATGGVEAVEEAIKFARAATGRKKIIGFTDSYHGQLFASLALVSTPESAGKIGPLVPEVVQMEYPDARKGNDILSKFEAELEQLLSKRDVAAFVTEAGIVTGGGSCAVAPPGYLTAARELTQKYGTLLIVDEVGTGFSRTGRLFGIDRENVVPDLIVFAKGISNGGAAIGAVVGKAAIIEEGLPNARLSSTFGWTPVACAAAFATLTVNKRDKVWEEAERKGGRVMEAMIAEAAENPRVVNVRGLGLEIAVELKEGLYEKVEQAAAAKGLHLTGDDEAIFQLMPPLTIPDGLLDEGLAIFREALRK